MHHVIRIKSVLNKTKRRDPWFLDDYTVNPYSGCSFNCLYCYIRGSKYGINMAEKVSVKENALEVLEKQLASRAEKQQYGFIVMSSATDPYLQLEQEHMLTRRMLELILKYRFPLHVITKSELVTRDFDLLEAIAQAAILPPDLEGKLAHKVLLTFSFSTLDDATGKIFEPGATRPQKRLETLIKAVNAGFHAGVSLMPLLPYISDTGQNLHTMFSRFKEAGAHYIFPASLTLFGDAPYNSKTMVFNAVAKYYPHLLPKYERLFAEGSNMPAYYTQAFSQKADALCRQYGIPGNIV